MNFMNRRMFQVGGASNTLGAYQIRDKVTGEVYDIKPDFIDTFGFNPYKILMDDSLEKGSAVQSILEDFQEKDAPKIGPFQARQDIGTNIANIGFRVARAAEPMVRAGIRGVGEVTGSQFLKDAGGDFSYGRLPEGEGRFGQRRGVMVSDSVIPSDQDRSRFMLQGITVKDPIETQPIVEDTSTFDFRDEDMRSKVSQSDFLKQQREMMLSQYSLEDQAFLRQNPNIMPNEVGMRPIKSEPSVDVYNESLNLDELSTSLAELSGERIDLESRFAEEDIQRPTDINVDEITSLLDEVTQPSINIEKTEAESLAETISKFDPLSEDELKFELDKQNLPGMDALDENKKAVADQIKVIKKLEAEGIDPDEYFNKAINIGTKENYRNDTDKKLNQPGFFGTDRFLDFVRNVGAGLAESGQMGPGLVLGAAKAAEERAARDIAKDQADAEMAKLIAIEEAKAALDPGEQLKPQQKIDLAGEINADYNDVVSSTNVLEVVDRVESIVLNEDTTSGKAIVKEFLTKAGSIFNVKTGKPDPNGVSWDKLDSRTRARVLLNQITQKNIRDILGESGKTISNLDRQIVERLVGSLEIGKTDAEVLETLNETRKGITTNLQNASNRLKTNYAGMSKYGDLALIGSPNIVTFLNTGKLKDTIYSNQYASYSQPRTAITLAKE
tara:strand:+ start:37005 stop:39014 length:2010 start_codon:yes stop_codon:yes gene_type:complete